MLNFLANSLAQSDYRDVKISLICQEQNFKDFFRLLMKLHQEAVTAAWANEASKVASDPQVSDTGLWTNADSNRLLPLVKGLADYECRLCFLAGHEASYCPFNAQMNRVSATSLENHALWKRWRIARAQFVKNVAATEAVRANCIASKTRAATAASVSAASAQVFQ